MLSDNQTRIPLEKRYKLVLSLNDALSIIAQKVKIKK